MLLCSRSLVGRYAVAVLAVAVALVLKGALDALVGQASPFLLAISAVMVAAWYGGLGPGLLATTLAALGTATFIFPPVVSPRVEDPVLNLHLSLFATEGLLISLLAEALHAARRRAEDAAQQLRASEQRFRTLVESAPIGITFSHGGRTAYANPAYLRMFGYEQEAELIGRPILDLIAREERPRIAARNASRERGEDVPVSYETTGLRKDGTTFPFHADVARIQLADGPATLALMIDLTEQRRAEQAWRQSEARLRRLFDSNLIGILFADTGGRVVEANDAFLNLVGYTRDDLRLGRIHWKGITPPEYRHPDLTACEELIRAGSHTPVEKEYVRKDGTRVPVLIGRATLDGDTGMIVGFVLDLTGLRRAEQALRESEARLRHLVDANIIGIFQGEVGGRITEANDAFLRMIGYTRDDLEAGRIRRERITPPEHRQRDHRGIEELLATGACAPFEKEYVRPDGTRVPVLIGAALLDRDTPRWIGFVLDLTERRRTERALQTRSDRLRLLSETATQLLIVERPEDLVQDLFGELSEHLGVEVYLIYLVAEEGPGLVLNACAGLPDAVRERIRDLPCGEASCVAIGRRASLTVEDAQQPLNPMVRLVHELDLTAFACHPLLAQGRLLGVLALGSRTREAFDPEELGLMRAVCDQVAAALERRRLLRELQRRAEALAEADAAKDRFLAVLSHELRTPLTPVLVEVSALLEDPETPAAVRPALEVTRRNVELEARLIDDLLDVTRIRRGKLHLDRRTVDVHDLVRRAVEICRDEIAARGLTLQVDLRAAEHHVEADPARLQQVLWNLIKNATKFTPSGGSIAVRSRDASEAVSGPRLVVEVADTGVGITPEALPKLFNAFEQGDPAVAKRFGGLGLGLAISRSLTEAHGGRLIATSAGQGHGATFTVELPTVPAPCAERVEPTGSRTNGSPRTSLRLLLVEDNPDTLRVMARLLARNGHRVVTASDMASALEVAAAEGPFDVVVSDIGLPDGSGLDLMRRLRERGPARGIALSGYGMEEDFRRTREAGFSAHLVKPVSFPALQEAILQVAAAAVPEAH